MLEARPLAIPDIIELTPPRFRDNRGFFSETYNKAALAECGITVPFVQDNQSLSVDVGVVRGLHYQLPPKAQDKLVRVTRGRVYDVAVDIREGSSTFGQWVAAELSAENWKQLFVPKGFAHGFMSLEPNSEVVYKMSDFYSKVDERSIRFDDTSIGVEWPLPRDKVILSEKDIAAPTLADAEIFAASTASGI